MCRYLGCCWIGLAIHYKERIWIVNHILLMDFHRQKKNMIEQHPADIRYLKLVKTLMSRLLLAVLAFEIHKGEKNIICMSEIAVKFHIEFTAQGKSVT
jgi:hypothetical protein